MTKTVTKHAYLPVCLDYFTHRSTRARRIARIEYTNRDVIDCKISGGSRYFSKVRGVQKLVFKGDSTIIYTYSFFRACAGYHLVI